MFIVDLEDNIVALDRRAGSVFWRTALPVVRKKKFFSVWSGPTLAGNMLWAVSNDKRLLGVDPGDAANRRRPQAAEPGLREADGGIRPAPCPLRRRNAGSLQLGMIPKSECRFSDKIMLQQRDRASILIRSEWKWL